MGKDIFKSGKLLPRVIMVSKVNPVLLVEPGKVKLNKLNDKNWKNDLSNFLHLHGHVCINNHDAAVAEKTKAHRRHVLFLIIGRLVKGRHLPSLASVKPRYLPWLLEDWKSQGISESLQLNNYYHLRWFWKICGIVIPKFPEGLAETSTSTTGSLNSERQP